MGPIIKAEGVSKQYQIGDQKTDYPTLRDAVAVALRKPLRWVRAGRRPVKKFWALKDVSFEIEPGEAVGIIGRNGAGKSTLLKILSRITEPTTGRIELYGRVSSLLEVGTGFHPELSGRENVFLNGAILGMKRTEISRKFDEIVAFAEISKFLDTPVKYYSSGMYMRLAFAVAAHLEPDILIIDEVLAVGDARFQRRCLDKMQDVGSQGRTVIFVSHNMPAVTRLCPRAILLHDGEVLENGPSHGVVDTYLNSGLGPSASREWLDPASAPGNAIVRLRQVRVRGGDGRVGEAIDIRLPVHLEVEYEVFEGGHYLLPNFKVYNKDGTLIFLTHDSDPAWRRQRRPAGYYLSVAEIPGNFLAEGSFLVGVAISQHIPSTEIHAHVGDAVAFQVVDSLEGDSARGDYGARLPGVVRPLLNWKTVRTSPDAALTVTLAEEVNV